MGGEERTVRADRRVHELGLAPSRERAKALVLAGRVYLGASRVEKPGQPVPRGAELRVEDGGEPYVSRGGRKLEAALARFGVSPRGRACLDVGASTGGFTHCLLGAGAARVWAVDVGRGQLDWTLRNDPRVTCLEQTNARDLAPADLGGEPELVTADVSFISLTKVLPALVRCAPHAPFVVLVKPQFEAGRHRVGRGGVVRDPATWEATLAAVAGCCAALGLAVVGAMASPLVGPAGNREFFLHAVPAPDATARSAPLDLLRDAVAEAREATGAGG